MGEDWKRDEKMSHNRLNSCLILLMFMYGDQIDEVSVAYKDKIRGLLGPKVKNYKPS